MTRVGSLRFSAICRPTSISSRTIPFRRAHCSPQHRIACCGSRHCCTAPAFAPSSARRAGARSPRPAGSWRRNGGTHSFLMHHAERLGLTHTFVDLHDPKSWERALTPKTRLVIGETITNPLMRVPALREMVAFARQHHLTTLLDNTFASPVNF